jgi:predicted nuclease with TOPRIM domain
MSMDNLNKLNNEYERLRLEYNEYVHLIQETIIRKSQVEQKMWRLAAEIGNLKKSLEKA